MWKLSSFVLDRRLPYAYAYINCTTIVIFRTLPSFTVRIPIRQQYSFLLCCHLLYAWAYGGCTATVLFRTLLLFNVLTCIRLQYSSTLYCRLPLRIRIQQQYVPYFKATGFDFPQLPSAMISTVDHPLGPPSLLRSLLSLTVRTCIRQQDGNSTLPLFTVCIRILWQVSLAACVQRQRTQKCSLRSFSQRTRPLETQE
jgi:hypothetical protein